MGDFVPRGDGDNWIDHFPFDFEGVLYDEEPEWDEYTEKNATGTVVVTYRQPANFPAWLIHQIGGDFDGYTEWGLPVRQVDFVLASG